MKKIKLYTNDGISREVMISPEDHSELSIHKWFYHSQGYACRTTTKDGVRQTILMHRQIMEFPLLVDHINGNKLDNRRDNLRSTSRATNALNSKMRSDNTTGYRGISWDNTRNRWFVSARKDGKTYSAGRFTKISDAILARSNLIGELHGWVES